jgi:hypothetical protein
MNDHRLKAVVSIHSETLRYHRLKPVVSSWMNKQQGRSPHNAVFPPPSGGMIFHRKRTDGLNGKHL